MQIISSQFKSRSLEIVERKVFKGNQKKRKAHFPGENSSTGKKMTEEGCGKHS